MEPIKGGNLIKLPEKPMEVLNESGLSPANIAVRFAATPKNMVMVLSGMSTIEQMEENVSFMEDFKPLDEEEIKLTQKIANLIREENLISCTACRYCVDGCPQHILIPDLFACYNSRVHFNDWNAPMFYKNHTIKNGKASDCIKCGKCEKSCPQHLPIRELLETVAKEFEK